MAGGLSQSVQRAIKCSVGGYGVGPKHVVRTAHKAWGTKTRNQAEAASNKLANKIANKIVAGATRR